MPDMPKSKETGDKDDHDDNIDGPPLPLSSLRLFVPPLRLVSAALWQVVQQGDIMDYGLVEEFVTTVLEVVPDMMSYREKVQLAMGLRAKLVLELCESVQTVDLEAIQPHLSRIRAITNIEKMPDPEVEASESKFLELVRTLLDNPNKKIFFFKEVFPVEFGPMYDTALQTLMWEFLSRLEKLLPTPTFQETASWLRPAPSLLKECAQTVTQPHPLKTLLLHHRCHGHLFTNVPSSCVNDHILSSLSHSLSEKMAMDIDEACTKTTYVPRYCPVYSTDYEALKEENYTDEELDRSLDTVNMMPVELMDKGIDDCGLATEVAKVETEMAEEVSQPSSMHSGVVGPWSLEETKALITIWSKEEILLKLKQSYRNKHVYSEISNLLNTLGFQRTWKQCKKKIRDLECSYRKALINPSSSIQGSCSLFSELRCSTLDIAVETGQVSDGEEMSLEHDEGPSVDVYLEDHQHEEMASSKVTPMTLATEQKDEIEGHEAFHSPQNDRIKIEGETHCCQPTVKDVSNLDFESVVPLPQLHDNALMTFHPCCFNDHVLSSLPRMVSEKVETDIGTNSEFSCAPRNCLMYNNESEALMEKNNTEKELGMSLDTVVKSVEITDRTEEGVKNYEERLHRQKQTDAVVKVGILYAEDVSQTSSPTVYLGRPWSLEETKELIAIWSDKQILQKLKKSYRKRNVYSEISKLLNNHGFKRTWKQCQTKIRDMKYSYRRALRNPSSGSSGSVTCLFFSELRSLLSAMPDDDNNEGNGQVSDGDEMFSYHDEGPSVDVYLEEHQHHQHEEMATVKGTPKTLTTEQADVNKGHEAVYSPKCEGIKIEGETLCCQHAVDDMSHLDLQPIVLLPQLNNSALMTLHPSCVSTLPRLVSEKVDMDIDETRSESTIGPRNWHIYNLHPSCLNDPILSSLPHLVPEKLEMDFESESICAPRNCPRFNNDSETLKAVNNVEELRISLDTVVKSVEITDRNEGGKRNYDKRLKHRKPTDAVKVGKLDAEDVSQISTMVYLGRPWTLEETKVLIAIWSKKEILQKLKQSYRKRNVYSEISKLLNNYGFKRTWKQCQRKIRDMKYSYRRALRNPSSSGSVTCSFYSELHTLLSTMPHNNEETGNFSDEEMSLDQDEGPSVNVYLEDLPHKEKAFVTENAFAEEPTEERKSDNTFQSSQSDKLMKIKESHCCLKLVDELSELALQSVKELSDEDISSTSYRVLNDESWTQNYKWTLEETQTLIAIWSNEEILKKLEQNFRNKHIYSEMSKLLDNHGFKRTWKQCQTKIRDLKYMYRRALRDPSSRVNFSFFSELHTFLSALYDRRKNDCITQVLEDVSVLDLQPVVLLPQVHKNVLMKCEYIENIILIVSWRYHTVQRFQGTLNID
ncbi:uncharacterized protein LOC105025853 isoform X4 [Esox lucius]|uniref:uncharacterized protein LOC105025853 isoform X4 n=1 Tax=Esox lucius TaxID=8010 RepID=UPI001476DE03|nr:uncharacterized protein LOC105025853 isoform X4 [Esox lucius]